MSCLQRLCSLETQRGCHEQQRHVQALERVQNQETTTCNERNEMQLGVILQVKPDPTTQPAGAIKKKTKSLFKQF